MRQTTNERAPTVDTMVTITDLHYTMEPFTAPVQEVGERLQRWFPGAPAEVRQAVCSFASALRASDYEARELAAYLGINFREVAPAEAVQLCRCAVCGAFFRCQSGTETDCGAH